MKRYLSFVSIFFFLAISTYSQVCGGGYNTFRVYVPNGSNAVNLRYQLYAVMPLDTRDDYKSTAKYLYKVFLPDDHPFLSRFWIRTVEVKESVAERFLANYKADKFRPLPADEEYFRQNKYAASIGAHIRFMTRELYDRPLLLKVFADNYNPVYLLGDHFGGCTRVQTIILDKMN